MKWIGGGYTEHIQKINDYISSLIKFDWERSKYEIKMDFLFPIISVLYWGMAFLFVYFSGLNVLSMMGTLMLYGIAYVSLMLPRIFDAIEIFNVNRWYRDLKYWIICTIAGIAFWMITTYIIMIAVWNKKEIGIYIQEIMIFGFFFFFIAIEINFISNRTRYIDYERNVLKDFESVNVDVFYSNVWMLLKLKKKCNKIFNKTNAKINYVDNKKSEYKQFAEKNSEILDKK